MKSSLVIQNAQLLLVQVAEEGIAIVHAPDALGNLFQSYVALDKGGGDHHPLAGSPADGTIPADVLHNKTFWVLPRFDRRLIVVRRAVVQLLGRVLVQGLVRTHVVV